MEFLNRLLFRTHTRSRPIEKVEREFFQIPEDIDTNAKPCHEQCGHCYECTEVKLEQKLRREEKEVDPEVVRKATFVSHLMKLQEQDDYLSLGGDLESVKEEAQNLMALSSPTRTKENKAKTSDDDFCRPRGMFSAMSIKPVDPGLRAPSIQQIKRQWSVK